MRFPAVISILSSLEICIQIIEYWSSSYLIDYYVYTSKDINWLEEDTNIYLLLLVINNDRIISLINYDINYLLMFFF
jgi:hypothetical protein